MGIGRSKSKRAKNIFYKKELEILSFIPWAKKTTTPKKGKNGFPGKKTKKTNTSIPKIQKFKVAVSSENTIQENFHRPTWKFQDMQKGKYAPLRQKG